jgi:hypothetical protein
MASYLAVLCCLTARAPRAQSSRMIKRARFIVRRLSPLGLTAIAGAVALGSWASAAAPGAAMPAKPGLGAAAKPDPGGGAAAPQAVLTTLKSMSVRCADEWFARQDICTTGDTCITSYQSCFPYRCNAAAKTCARACASNGDCAGGLACAGGKCVMPTPYCASKTLSRNPRGGERDCSPYLCDGATGTCRNAQCASVQDCAPPNVCTAQYKCEPYHN